MNFNNHSSLEGKHAFLSASNYHWINYTPEKMETVYANHLAALRGSLYHDAAMRNINLGIKLPKSKDPVKNNLAAYVNDAIGFKMQTEQVLYYSDNCFGTADAISFRNNKLRVHDLKTGVTPASVHQLEIYAALFCLEYNYEPTDISFELRIYQLEEVNVYEPTAEEIKSIMNKIVEFDNCINKLKEEEF